MLNFHPPLLGRFVYPENVSCFIRLSQTLEIPSKFAWIYQTASPCSRLPASGCKCPPPIRPAARPPHEEVRHPGHDERFCIFSPEFLVHVKRSTSCLLGVEGGICPRWLLVPVMISVSAYLFRIWASPLLHPRQVSPFVHHRNIRYYCWRGP